jgi:hypothetical protein
MIPEQVTKHSHSVHRLTRPEHQHDGLINAHNYKWSTGVIQIVWIRPVRGEEKIAIAVPTQAPLSQ